MDDVKADKRESILKATLELVAEHGFHDAPCSVIAVRAGVAAGTIYRYFDNKDVLINTLYNELESEINTALHEGLHPEQPVRDRFLHLATGLLKFFIAHPDKFRYVEQFHNSPYGADFRRDRLFGKPGERGIYIELFEQGLAQGIIKNLPLPVLCDLAFGPIISVVRNHILGFISLDDILIGQVVEACWDALQYHK